MDLYRPCELRLPRWKFPFAQLGLSRCGRAEQRVFFACKVQGCRLTCEASLQEPTSGPTLCRFVGFSVHYEICLISCDAAVADLTNTFEVSCGPLLCFLLFGICTNARTLVTSCICYQM